MTNMKITELYLYSRSKKYYLYSRSKKYYLYSRSKKILSNSFLFNPLVIFLL